MINSTTKNAKKKHLFNRRYQDQICIERYANHIDQ
jgi:hypothetical protein